MTLFDGQVAIDPVTNTLVRDGSLTIYAENDTAFATPLALTDLAGLPLATVSTSPIGWTQGFNTVDEHLSVVAKSGPYTVTLRSPYGTAQAAANAVNDATGANLTGAQNAQAAAETARTAAQTAKADAEAAAATATAPTEQVVSDLITTPGTSVNTSLSATFVAQADPTFTTAQAGTAPLGTDIATGTGWTLGTGWSGSFASGFTHTPGAVAPLTWAPGTLPAGRWIVGLTVSTTIAPDQDIAVTLADAPAAYIYNGGAAGSTYAAGFATTTPDGALTITPVSGFAGTITGITVRPVSTTVPPAVIYRDNAGANAVEVRPSLATLENLFLGSNPGRYNTTGSRNVAVGVRALDENTTGYWNTAFGYEVLTQNTNGSRNVAVGMRALTQNLSGYRNTAVGQSTMRISTTGIHNTAVGADTLYRSTDASYNVAVGVGVMGLLEHGKYNVAIGDYSMHSAETDYNTAVGRLSLYGSEGAYNVGVGDQAGRYIVGGGFNTAIGSSAQLYNATGSDNTTVGYRAGRGGAEGGANFSRVTALGRDAAYSLGSASHDVTALGYKAAEFPTGDRNVAIGAYALQGAAGATGMRNVAIGYQAGMGVTTGGFNTLIGVAVGSTLTTGLRNILIGQSVNTPAADSNDRLNIGNAIYGDLSAANRQIGIGISSMSAALHIKAGTAEAGTAPLKLNAGTVMTTPEAGAIEFDGTNLYFTTSGGVRKTVAVVA